MGLNILVWQLSFNRRFALLDTACFTSQLAQVEDTCTTYFTTLVHFDCFNGRISEREDTLNTNTTAHFTDGESFSGSTTTTLNHNTSKGLWTLFVTFFDLVGYRYSVSCLKCWEFTYRSQLLF